MSDFERPNIRAMEGYASGEQPTDAATIKLNTNENPYPPSPEVAKAIAALAAIDLRRYPQPTADPLREVIATHHNLYKDNVVITNGGDEALRLALTTFVEPGAAFGMAEPSYSLYPVLANIHDAKVVRVPLAANWRWPADFAERLNASNVQLTCVVNPHAPSGYLAAVQELTTLASSIQGVLLIDEAYADFIDPEITYDTATLLEKHHNVLILRTFSKGYSLAGLRLGYLLGSAALITPIVSKTRDSYNIDHISQRLGHAAFTDRAYAAATWAKVRASRVQLSALLGQLGLQAPPSQSNFLLVTVPNTAKLDAASLYGYLKQEGILVRYFDVPGLNDKLRISIGTDEENQRLVAALTKVLT